MDCLFCKIIDRQIPASIVYEDDRVLAFNDINPQGPTHVLVVPKRHIASLNELTEGDDQIVGEVVRRAAAIAKDRGVSAAGFRPCSTRTARPARRCSTSTCTSSAAAASPGRRLTFVRQPFRRHTSRRLSGLWASRALGQLATASPLVPSR
jgi:histidine triad (HIT) family protein